MRILLVHNYYQLRGGEDGYFDNLTSLLKRKGHEVIVYSKTSQEIKTIFDKIKVAAGMFYNPEIEKELSKIIKRHNPEIVQIQNIFPLITPAAYKVFRKNNLPVIQRISNYRIINPAGYHNSFLAFFVLFISLIWHRVIGSFKYVNVFIFPSSRIAKKYEKFLKIPKEKISIIPTFSNEFKSDKGNHIRKYFLYVGRLSKEKGIETLIKAFSHLSRARLIVIGGGPLETKLKINSSDNISFKGYLNSREVSSYWAKTIATIIPSSDQDVFPTVALESFFNKVPIIVSYHGPLSSLIENKTTGLTYINSLDLKNKIKYAYNNKIDMNKMGANAKNLYLKKYSQNVIYKKLLTLYSSL